MYVTWYGVYEWLGVVKMGFGGVCNILGSWWLEFTLNGLHSQMDIIYQGRRKRGGWGGPGRPTFRANFFLLFCVAIEL